MLVLVWLIGLIGAPPAAAEGPSFRVERTFSIPLATDGDLVLSDSYLLWQETLAEGASRIGGVDLRTNRRLPLPAPLISQIQPALAGMIAAWLEPTPASDLFTVVAFDLETHRRQVVSGPAAVPDYPAVAGVTIVWRDQRGGRWHIYGYDLVERQEFAIASSDQSYGPPSIDGRQVVWQAFRGDSWDLLSYDLDTRRLTPLVEGPDDQVNPVINRGRVVYEDRPHQGGASSLKLAPLTGGAATTIASGQLVSAPALSGRLVVWEDWRDGGAGIFAYDSERKATFPINRSDQARRPVVDDVYVAWVTTALTGNSISVALLRPILPSDRRDAPLRPDPNVLYFSETGHSITFGFKTFWQQHGGLPVFGYPLTEEFAEFDPGTGRERNVQYFERFVLEYDATETDPTKQVKVVPLGSQWLAGRQTPRADETDDTADRRYFPETGHVIEGRFKQFWDLNDGARLLGLPISSDIEENGRTVQYFERGRLELVTPPEGGRARAEPGPLGREILILRGWLAGGPAPHSEMPRSLR